MKVNKTQAIYKYLPNAWTVYEEKEGKEFFSARIKNWNTKKVDQIYKPKILNEIKRQINIFQAKGGDTSEFYKLNDDSAFEFYEAAVNEGIADINVTIDPFVFYCPKCGLAHHIKKHLNQAHYCTKCKTKLRQLQMVYSCECGFTKGVEFPYLKADMYYRTQKSQRSQFKFFYYEGKNERQFEIRMQCPNCKAQLYPKNASDKIHFIPFTNSSVNLINPKMGSFLEKGHNANLVLIARWLGFVSEKQFEDILENSSSYFDEDIDAKIEKEVQEIVDLMGVTREMALTYIKMKKNSGGSSFTEIIAHVDSMIQLSSNSHVALLAAQLVEYYALKDSKTRINLDRAKQKALQMENILDADEIDKINQEFGVFNTQLSSDVEIVNAAYGYTRRTSNPQNSDNGRILKLKPFFQNSIYNIFTSILDTEGILVEFDRLRIIQWLIDNEIIDDPQIKDDNEAKVWFMNHIDLTQISRFSDITYSNNDVNRTTKFVYTLIHTIAHMLLKSAGLISGLDKDSLSELILPTVPSIFIYSTSIQGMTLGSLSGLFEQSYKYFLDLAMNEYEVCTFDPICSENHNSSCFACTQVSDVSCEHFNKDLSRVFLYGGKINLDGNEILVKKGFWK